MNKSVFGKTMKNVRNHIDVVSREMWREGNDRET